MLIFRSILRNLVPWPTGNCVSELPVSFAPEIRRENLMEVRQMEERILQIFDSYVRRHHCKTRKTSQSRLNLIHKQTSKPNTPALVEVGGATVLNTLISYHFRTFRVLNVSVSGYEISIPLRVCIKCYTMFRDYNKTKAK